MLDQNDCTQDKLDRSVYITNLSFKMNNNDLEKAFSHIGKVEASHVFFDKELFRPAGRGIVLFSKKEEAQRAIKEMDDVAIKGRKIKVQLNTKSIKLLNVKKGSFDEEDSAQLYRHSSFSGERNHDNLHLSRSSSSHRPSRHHGIHHKHHHIAINDYDDYYDYDYYDRHVHSERDRERSRERIRNRDRSRHSIGKYDYDVPFDYDYDHNKSRINIKDIDKKSEKKQLNSRIIDSRDEKIVQESMIRDKKYIDHEPVQRQPTPPLLASKKIPISISSNSTIIQEPLPIAINYNQNLHGIDSANDSIDDTGNDIPHSLWLKVINERSHEVYNQLYAITKDHQIIKEKTLLRFQPNETGAVAKFIDALSPTSK